MFGHRTGNNSKVNDLIWEQLKNTLILHSRGEHMFCLKYLSLKSKFI